MSTGQQRSNEEVADSLDQEACTWHLLRPGLEGNATCALMREAAAALRATTTVTPEMVEAACRELWTNRDGSDITWERRCASLGDKWAERQRNRTYAALNAAALQVSAQQPVKK